MSSQNKMETEHKVRIDKWLWMVRLFKTRTLATDACNAGKVKINTVNCKPSREIKQKEKIQIRIGILLKTVEVLDFPKNRIGAKLVPDYYLDQTPEEEYERVKSISASAEWRDHGVGRPTKRDRRQLEYLKDMLSND
jgi:ribosome-associated heat shock protein Hsp15